MLVNERWKKMISSCFKRCPERDRGGCIKTWQGEGSSHIAMHNSGAAQGCGMIQGRGVF